MFIEITNHWISLYMSEIDDSDLPLLFQDISDFRRTGVLRQNSPLHVIDKYFREQCRSSDTMLRMVEDAVLFEMARRYHNVMEADREENIAGWKLYNDRKVRIFQDSGEDRFWKFIVTK